MCILNIAMILVSAVIGIWSLVMEPSDVQCVRQSSSWSPASNQVEYYWETFEDVNFFIKSLYLGLDQTAEIEKMWNILLPGSSTQ